MKKILVTIGFLVIMVGSAFSQTKMFTPEPYAFMDELKEFFAKSDANYESGKLLLK